MILQQSNVNPEMLTLARKSRRKTQGQLAKDAGITQANVSKCEAGVKVVDDELLPRFAGALGYPVRFFRQAATVKGPGISEFFHRKRVKISTPILHQAYALAEIRRLEIAKLLESREELCPQVPVFPVEEFDDDPAKIARTIRATWQLPPGPVFNIARTLELNGCIIVAHNFGTRALDGFSCCSTGMPPIFHINAEMPPDRWRWTLAHELGHIVMHTDIGEPGTSSSQREQQADIFAGEFLAPGHELLPMLWNLDFQRLAALKREWKISMQSLVMQAHRLGAITDRQKQAMFIRLSKSGYRQREPENLDPPIEVPGVLFNLAMFHMTKLEFTREELKDYLAVGESDFHFYYHDPYDILTTLR